MKMLPVDAQRSNEYQFSRRHVLAYTKTFITENEEVAIKIDEGVELVKQWLSHTYYASKERRLKEVRTLNIKELVTEIYCSVAMFQREETFVSAASQVAKHLKFEHRNDSIQTVAEMLGVLCATKVFVIWKERLESQMMLQCQMRLPTKLVNAIERSQYLPPMICEPNTIKSNYESGHLTFNEGQMLGRNGTHNDNICLDVLNLQNAIPLKLDTSFISLVEEEPTSELDSIDKINNWNRHKAESYEMYLHIANQGGDFYHLNAPDMRGRLYTCGYQINFQGTPFKRSCVELRDEEILTGI